MKKLSYPLSLLVTIFLQCFLLNNAADAKMFKASFARLPVAAESPEKGILIDFIKLIANATGDKVEIKVYPFKRSLENAIDNKADFHIPFIKNPYKPTDQLPFDYSTVPIFDVNFVLYTNKNKPVDIKNLGKYKVTTDAAHAEFFDFPIGKDFSIETSFRKLSGGRIDAYIFADVEADPVLKKLSLKNIKRQLFKIYHVHAILPKGQQGKGADQMIMKGLKIIKKNGEWDKLMKPIYHEYIDWQP